MRQSKTKTFVGLFGISFLIWTPALAQLPPPTETGVIAYPASPFDPSFPIATFVPGSLLTQAQKIQDSQGIPIPQTLLSNPDKLGIYPHLPTVADGRIEGLRILDSTIRWGKAFHSGLLDGDFYLGSKKSTMAKLHKLHIDITRGLHALSKSLDMASPNMPLPDPNFASRTITAEALMTQTLISIGESHDLIETILAYPPANIDPDMLLDMLDGLQVGSNYRFSSSHPQALVGSESEVKRHLHTYCVAQYLPWLLGQNAKRGLFTASPSPSSKALIHHLLMGMMGNTLALPTLGEGLKAWDTQAPGFTLGSLFWTTQPSPTGEDKPIVTLNQSPVMVTNPGTRIAPWLQKLAVPEADAKALISTWDTTPMAIFQFEVLQTELAKLAALTPWLTTEGRKVSISDIEALRAYTDRPHDENAFPPSTSTTALDTFLEMWPHAYTRAKWGDTRYLDSAPEVQNYLTRFFGWDNTENPQTLPLTASEKWVANHVEQSQLFLCQAVLYQNYYDAFLANPGKTHYRTLLHERASPKNHPTRWQANIVRPDFLQLFAPPLTKDRLTSSGEPLAGWGYYNDILMGLGKIPLLSHNHTYRAGPSLEDHSRIVLPTMLRSPYELWENLFYGLILTDIDLSRLPQFGWSGPDAEHPQNPSWIFQDTAHHTMADSLTVSLSASANASDNSPPPDVIDRLKHISLFLFRNRVGFTPQEKYLFLTTYFNNYLLPLAYTFSHLSSHILKDAKLERLTRFEVPKGAIDQDLIKMLGGQWNPQGGGASAFMPQPSPKLAEGENASFELKTQGTNLMISFLEPILQKLQAPKKSQRDITPYDALITAAARIKRHLHQRMQWCWQTPRHTLPVPGVDDQRITRQQNENPLMALMNSNSQKDFSVQRRARSAASAYHYPLKTSADSVYEEKFPLSLKSDSYSASDSEAAAKSAETRDMWLYALCTFPKFIDHYIEGYVTLAQQYQKAMALFRHAEIFQRARRVDASYLPYLEGLPDRFALSSDYADVDAQNRYRSKLKYTVYTREVENYQREKSAFTSNFDMVETLIEGAIKINYAASDYVHALENYYFMERGSTLYNALASLPLSENTLQQNAKAFWPPIHEHLNKIIGESPSKDRRTHIFDYRCYSEENTFSQHIIYRNKLACSLQRQLTLRNMLQRILVTYRQAMDTFWDIPGVTSANTNSGSSDEILEKLLAWAAQTFSAFLTTDSISNAAAFLKSFQRQEDPLIAYTKSMMGIKPDTVITESTQNDVSWIEGLTSLPDPTPTPPQTEIDRIRLSIVTGFLSDMAPAIPPFLKPDNTADDPIQHVTDNLSLYKSLVTQAFGATSVSVHDIPLTQWLFGPGILFSTTAEASLTSTHMQSLKTRFKAFYPLVQIPEETTLSGYALSPTESLTNNTEALTELLGHFNHKILDYALGNIINAKMLLGHTHTEGTASTIRQTLHAQLGSLGESSTIPKWYRGVTETYGEVSPLGITLFIYNRESGLLEGLRNFFTDSSASRLPFFSLINLNLSTQPGPLYELSPYEGRLPGVHLWMHRLFSQWGARLRGGSFLLDQLHLRKPESWDAEDIFAFRSIWNSPFTFNALNLIYPEIHPEQSVHPEMETSGLIRTLDTVQLQTSDQERYFDVFTTSHTQPSVSAFTPAQWESLEFADRRIISAHREMQTNDAFRTGSEELKAVQGAKVYESALLWTFLELLNTYVIEPYVRAGMELQQLFGRLDTTLALFFGPYVGRGGSGVPWTTGLGDKAVELRFPEIWEDMTSPGLLHNFSHRLSQTENTIASHHRASHLTTRLKKLLHIHFVPEIDSKPYRMVEDRVDVPGHISGENHILRFIHGGMPKLFTHSNKLEALVGGNPDPKPLYVSGDSCLATDTTLIAQAMLPKGKISKGEYQELKTDDERRDYLSKVQMANTLTQYASYLDMESQSTVRPGFCHLKKLALMSAYKLLIRLEALEAEEKKEQENPADACHLLSNETELVWAVGKDSSDKVDAQARNQSYCHEVLYSFKVAQMFRTTYGFGADLPRPAEEPMITLRDGHQVIEKRISLYHKEDHHLLLIYEDTRNELQQWRNTFVHSVALKHPLLDAQVAPDDPSSPAFGQWLTAQATKRPFIRRAFLEIIRKHYPYGNTHPLEDVIDHFANHHGPITEFFHTQILPQADTQALLLKTPKVQNRLMTDEHINASPVAATWDAVTAFAHTEVAKHSPGKNALTTYANTHYLPIVSHRLAELSQKLSAAFPWMEDVTMAGGQLGPTLSNWLTYFVSEGPATAIKAFVSSERAPEFSARVSAFISDTDPHLGYTGILTSTIERNLDLIKQTFQQTYAVDTVSDSNVSAKTLERDKLMQLLAQRFSQPQLYESVRQELGPRFDFVYHYFVPIQVYKEFKAYEQYQAVAGVISSTVFAVQIMLSLNILSSGLRSMLSGAMRLGARAGGSFAVTRGLGATAGFLLATYTGLVITSAVWGWLVGYNFFKIFGADWKTIHVSFVALTGLAAIFMGLSHLRGVGMFFNWVKPILHWCLTLGWYFFVMDVVMYFGDRVTLDSSLLWYGWAKAMFDTYITRRGLELDPKSSIGAMFQREAQMVSAYGKSKDADTEHAPIFTEYDYIKHLQQTSFLALSYVWFGVMMAGMMDYAQVRSVIRYKGFQPLPNHPTLSGLAPFGGGIQGMRYRLKTEFLSHIPKNDEGGVLSARDKLDAISDLATHHLSTEPWPKDIRLNGILSHLVRSGAQAFPSWGAARSAIHHSLTQVFQNPSVEALLQSHKQKDWETFRKNLHQELRSLTEIDLSEMHRNETYLLGDNKRKALTEALQIIDNGNLSDVSIRTFVDHLFPIDPDTFADAFADNIAKFSAVYHYAPNFMKYQSQSIKHKPILAKQLGRSPSDDELHAFVTTLILKQTRWTEVDDQLQTRIIRGLVQNHLGFALWHGTWRNIWKAKHITRIRHIPSGIIAIWRYLAARPHAISVSLQGADMPENYSHILLGIQLTKALADLELHNYNAYMTALKDLVPEYLPLLDAVISASGSDIPDHIRDGAQKLRAHYDILSDFVGWKESETFTSEDITQALPNLRHLLDLIAIGYLDGHEVRIAPANMSDMLELLSSQERVLLVKHVVPWATERLQLTPSEWTMLLKKVDMPSPDHVEKYVSENIIEALFVDHPNQKAAVDQLIGELLYQKIKNTQRQVFAKFWEAKKDILLLMHRVKTGGLLPQNTLVRLITEEDLKVLSDAGASHTFLSHVGKSESDYLSTSSKQWASGAGYVSLVADVGRVDAFLKQLEGSREFGAAGPYLALTHTDLPWPATTKMVSHNQPPDITPETFLILKNSE